MDDAEQTLPKNSKLQSLIKRPENNVNNLEKTMGSSPGGGYGQITITVDPTPGPSSNPRRKYKISFLTKANNENNLAKNAIDGPKNNILEAQENELHEGALVSLLKYVDSQKQNKPEQPISSSSTLIPNVISYTNVKDKNLKTNVPKGITDVPQSLEDMSRKDILKDDNERLVVTLPDPFALQVGLEKTLGMADFKPFNDEDSNSRQSMHQEKLSKNTHNTNDTDTTVRGKNYDQTGSPISKHLKDSRNETTKSKASRHVEAPDKPKQKEKQSKFKKEISLDGSSLKEKELKQSLRGRSRLKSKKIVEVKENDEEELLSEVYTTVLERWRDYINMDDGRMWLEELSNALEYAYNEDALDMICFRDTSVWQIIQDMTYGPTHI